MKIRCHLFAALLLAVFSATAQDRKLTFHTLPASTTTYVQSSRWMLYVDMAFLTPVRRWGDEVYDFRPARATFNSGTADIGDFHLRAGKIVCVNAEGVLIELDERQWSSRRLVFLRNPAFRERLVDGEAFAAIGRTAPPYVYTSVIGARRTVESFDCGALPDSAALEQAEALAKAVADQKAEALRAAIQSATAAKAEADAKRMAEAKARAAKAFADRAAKEAAEKQPTK